MVVVTIAAHLFPVSPLLGLRLWPQFCLTLCFVSGVKSVNTHTHTHTHKRLRYLPKCQINPSNLSWPAFLQHRKHTVAVTKDENLGHVNTVEIHGPEKQAPLSSDDGRQWWPTIDIVTEVVFFYLELWGSVPGWGWAAVPTWMFLLLHYVYYATLTQWWHHNIGYKKIRRVLAYVWESKWRAKSSQKNDMQHNTML